MSAIVCTGLSKRYGSTQALKNVSLTVPSGSVFGLLGPNGAGKTTLFSIILGYIAPSEGDVRVLGVSPRDLFRLQGKVSALPQDADLPPTLTVRETLRFFAGLNGITAIDGEVDRVLKIVDMSSWQGARLRALSHGMKKRVFIAQALLGDPDLILLDEPSAGLDPKHAHELGQIFKSLRATVLMSSHNLSELEDLCDHAAILVKGDVVRAGTMDEIRNADQEVHIHVVAPSYDEPRLLREVPGLAASFDREVGKLTLRFSATVERPSERVTTEALQALIAQGALIREVERGQSLLQTYLALS
jgi:ABC-type multidrug transport system ATPase subunit